MLGCSSDQYFDDLTTMKNNQQVRVKIGATLVVIFRITGTLPHFEYELIKSLVSQILFLSQLFGQCVHASSFNHVNVNVYEHVVLFMSETKLSLLCASSSNLADILTMIRR